VSKLKSDCAEALQQLWSDMILESRSNDIGAIGKVMDYVKYLEANQRQWISVKERLPETIETLVQGRYESGRVLILERDRYGGGISIGCYYSDTKTWDIEDSGGNRFAEAEVTHRMPLPEAPEEK